MMLIQPIDLVALAITSNSTNQYDCYAVLLGPPLPLTARRAKPPSPLPIRPHGSPSTQDQFFPTFPKAIGDYVESDAFGNGVTAC
jgi:hypothetical protein